MRLALLSPLLLLLACASQPAPAPPLPSSADAAGPISVAPQGVPPAVVQAARAAVVAARGGEAAALTVVSAETIDWPDACLGLGAPGEVCAMWMMEGGWRLVLEADGARHTVRTSATGDLARVE